MAMRHREPRPDDIVKRSLTFVCHVIDQLVGSLPDRPGIRRVADQLVGASGGIGSHLEEAAAASSRREFVRFNEIALRESRESTFWLKVCRQTNLGDQRTCAELLSEAEQISRIIAKIIINTKHNGL
jgi:four helix bundle protein